MPRHARLDAPGALHHVMARGIERREIFAADVDRQDFLGRLARLANAGAFEVFAWALLPNHFHLLVRTGSWPLSRSMRSMLSGYATGFNRRHRRAGHLFQNRFKSILCEEEPYFLELVRYLHLNPIRAGLVRGLAELDRYPWTGHSALVGRVARPWQQTAEVLARFGRRRAVTEYRAFVAGGQRQGSRPELMGGGLLRSNGGWEAVAALRRGREQFESDERILGSSAFVEEVRLQITPDEEATKIDLGTLMGRLSREAGVSREALASGSRVRIVARVRAELSWIWSRHLGRNGRELARALSLSPAAIHNAAVRFEEVGRPRPTRLKMLLRREPDEAAEKKR